MSSTAQKKDISDPDVIFEFATHVGDQIRLKYLYLLTVADIRATGDSVWNSWKDSLLKNLYYSTRDVLRQGLANPILISELITENKRLSLELLTAEHSNEAINDLWSTMGDDYFTRHSVEEIVWQTNSILNSTKNNIVIAFNHSSKHNVTSLFIYTETFPGLFKIITSVIDFFKLDIVDARISESKSGFAFDTYHITNPPDLQIDESTCNKVRQKLQEQISLKQGLDDSVGNTMLSRRAKHFQFPTTVSFDDKTAENFTIVTIKSPDQSGLLSQLASVITRHKLNIITAKIATYGELIEDIFSLTNENGEKLSSSEQQQLSEDIIKQLDNTD